MYLAATSLEYRAFRRLDKVALVFAGQEYTYSFLNAEASRMANALSSLGLRKVTG